MAKRKIQRYGWRKDTPDLRDHLYIPEAQAIPPVYSLRDEMPPVYDQGQLGSCTGNAIAGALHFEALQQGEDWGVPSRLFIYYEERVIEDSVEWDSGAEIRDGIKVVAKKGAP